MHYSNLVVIDGPADITTIPDLKAFSEDAVKRAMGPHEDAGGFWDWYQIGGRWTGTLDGYDPDRDPALMETCDYCERGITTAAIAARFPAYAVYVGKLCIQCKGAGKRTKWPTQWGFHKGDVQPIAQLTQEQYAMFYRVIVGGTPYARERYEPWHAEIRDRFVEQALPSLEWLKAEYANHLVVVVDNHS